LHRFRGANLIQITLFGREAILSFHLALLTGLPDPIAKREVWGTFKRVKFNQGTAGKDGQSVAVFQLVLFALHTAFAMRPANLQR